MKFRKKPVVVEAEIYKPGMEDGFQCLMEVNTGMKCFYTEKECLHSNCTEKQWLLPYIKTLEGKHYISKGDYIVTGVKGERYPVKPEIFAMTYDKVEEENK